MNLKERKRWEQVPFRVGEMTKDERRRLLAILRDLEWVARECLRRWRKDVDQRGRGPGFLASGTGTDPFGTDGTRGTRGKHDGWESGKSVSGADLL